MADTRVLISWNGSPIGEVLPGVGKVLDKQAFSALRPVERLRVYLLLVAPASRPLRVIARVCQLTSHSALVSAGADLADGSIVRVARGHYRAVPAVNTTDPEDIAQVLRRLHPSTNQYGPKRIARLDWPIDTVAVNGAHHGK